MRFTGGGSGGGGGGGRGGRLLLITFKNSEKFSNLKVHVF